MANKNVIAVVLAGGEGKRFWPFTTYKSMIPLFGKTILEHTLETLRIAGIRSAVIVANPKDAKTISSFEIDDMHLDVVIQEKPTGMSDAVVAAKDMVGGRPCLILNAEDVVDDVLLEGMMKQLDDSESLIVGKRVDSYFAGGYLRVKGNQLAEIVEKPGEGKEPSDLVNLVFHYFRNPAEFYRVIISTQSTKDDVYERALTSFAAQHTVNVIAYNGPWQPLKFPWHLLDIMGILSKHLEPHRGKDVEIKKNVIIDGSVYIEDGVKIFENTKIIGPCYIGRNTIIGNNNIIRASHIGADCVTGFNTDITRSYVGDGCWFHSNYIGDSVLEGGMSMGSGAVLANLRLDDGEISSVVRGEKLKTGRNKLGATIASGVRIGVNASVMPGIKIGKNSFVGAGVILDRDLPEDSFCMNKTGGYTVKKNITQHRVSRDEFKSKI